MRVYSSTRGGGGTFRAAEAILKGLAPDGGLFVPDAIPRMPDGMTEKTKYQDIAEAVIGAFFDDYTEDEIRHDVLSAYDTKFDTPEIVPLVKAGGAYFLELYHGKTSAFKDMALSILPYLLMDAVRKTGDDKKILILTATSGDTGKAALEGFAGVDGTEIAVFYPKSGVSEIQKRQMVTQEGANTHVFAINGNFDDAQTGVKAIFEDKAFAEKLAGKGVRLSSANSINIGRLIPQVAYYVYAYNRLLEDGEITKGEKINICVPTGNFGNILAAYFAREMGLPVAKLICASNVNNVLTDFIDTGVYDVHRQFCVTNSPSMDILVSSNLERLLFLLCGRDGAEVANLMDDLKRCGRYEVSEKVREGMKLFYGGFATPQETTSTIGRLYASEGYLTDTHTAVAYKVYRDYAEETGDTTKTVIASTASPFKFPRSVAEALGMISDGDDTDDFEISKMISRRTGLAIPRGLADIEKKPVLHERTVSPEGMKQAIEEIL